MIKHNNNKGKSNRCSVDVAVALYFIHRTKELFTCSLDRANPIYDDVIETYNDDKRYLFFGGNKVVKNGTKKSSVKLLDDMDGGDGDISIWTEISSSMKSGSSSWIQDNYKGATRLGNKMSEFYFTKYKDGLLTDVPTKYQWYVAIKLSYEMV